jgi:serine protease Do
MKRLSHALVAFPLVATLLVGPARAEEPRAKKENLRLTPEVKAIRKAKPSVVTFKITRRGAYSTREVLGSGVFVDERGYAITNKHVITGAESIKGVMADGSECAAKVLVEDARYDLAIVKLAVTTKVKAITFAPTSDLEQGETVIAIGHPYGYVNTVSTGIVSALNRTITMPSGEELTGLIQVTASINPGNSGGPLLNIYGDLIGINVAVRDGAQGIAFALNGDMVQAVLARHLSASNISHIAHGLACRETMVPDADEPRGQVVVETAAQDTVKHGDVILTVGEQAVTNRFDLERSLWDRKAGDVVAARVVRDGKETQVMLKLGDGRVASADTRRTGNGDLLHPVAQR